MTYKVFLRYDNGPLEVREHLSPTAAKALIETMSRNPHCIGARPEREQDEMRIVQ